MTAKFYIIGSFLIRSRNMFVAVGDIVDGYVEPGMTVTIDLGNISVGTKVQSVEVIDVDYLGKSYKGLAFAYDDPAELDLWQSLHLSDETVIIEST